jgi:hypothetical protein
VKHGTDETHLRGEDREKESVSWKLSLFKDWGNDPESSRCGEFRCEAGGARA